MSEFDEAIYQERLRFWKDRIRPHVLFSANGEEDASAKVDAFLIAAVVNHIVNFKACPESKRQVVTDFVIERMQWHLSQEVAAVSARESVLDHWSERPELVEELHRRMQHEVAEDWD